MQRDNGTDPRHRLWPIDRAVTSHWVDGLFNQHPLVSPSTSIQCGRYAMKTYAQRLLHRTAIFCRGVYICIRHRGRSHPCGGAAARANSGGAAGGPNNCRGKLDCCTPSSSQSTPNPPGTRRDGSHGIRLDHGKRGGAFSDHARAKRNGLGGVYSDPTWTRWTSGAGRVRGDTTFRGLWRHRLPTHYLMLTVVNPVCLLWVDFCICLQAGMLPFATDYSRRTFTDRE